MPTLAPPPPSVSVRLAPAPAPRFPSLAQPPISSLGRSLADYTVGFALDIDALRGRDVLDVGAGASSFVAEACARRIHAVAVDPLYSQPPESLALRVQSDLGRSASVALRTNGNRSAAVVAPRPAPVEPDRSTPDERFLADYATHYIHSRYVAGALPRLPFFDGTFDLVLCAHLPFVERDRFDLDWHLAALRELVRVSAGEARVQPLGTAGRAYPALARLRRDLRTHGIATEVVPVGPLFTQANAMLVLRRAVA